MKKLLIIAFLLFNCQAFAADTKVTNLTADTTPDLSDLLMTVDDPSGSAVNKKATIGNVLNAANDLDAAGDVINDSHSHTGSTLSNIDISADTNLAGDTEIVLTDDTLSIASGITRDTEWNGLNFLVGTATASLSGEIVVGTTPGGSLGGTWASPTIDDLFLKNSESDTMTGTLTADGLTLGADENITWIYNELSKTLDYNGTKHDFVFNDDVDIEDTSPHLSFRDTTANTGFQWHYDNEDPSYPGLALFSGTDDGTGFIASENNYYPLIWFDTSEDVRIPYSDFYVGSNRVPNEFSVSGYYENLVAADDNISLGAWGSAVTITGVGCTYNGTGTTKATITLEDGSGNAMTITGTNPVCVANGTDMTFAPVTAGNTLNAGELLRFDVTNTPDPTTDDYLICIKYRYN